MMSNQRGQLKYTVRDSDGIQDSGFTSVTNQTAVNKIISDLSTIYPDSKIEFNVQWKQKLTYEVIIGLINEEKAHPTRGYTEEDKAFRGGRIDMLEDLLTDFEIPKS